MTSKLSIDIDSLLSAGSVAGRYLESIKKTDLASLTAEEWKNFLCIIVAEYLDREIPF